MNTATKRKHGDPAYVKYVSGQSLPWTGSGPFSLPIMKHQPAITGFIIFFQKKKKIKIIHPSIQKASL